MKKVIPLVGGLIALYLIVTNSKGVSSLISGAGSGSSNLVKTLQGRN